MTFQQPPVIIVKCEDVNMTDLFIYRKGVGMNYKNVNKEIIGRDCLHKEFRTNESHFGY